MQYTTVEEIRYDVEVAIEETKADMAYGGEEVEVDEGAMWADMIVGLALSNDAAPELIAEACRRELGYVPQDLLRMRPEVGEAFKANGGYLQ